MWRLTCQRLLAEQIYLGEGCLLVRREYPTAIGPVDIMAGRMRTASPWRLSSNGNRRY